jgi:hypothetical protein
VLWALDNLLPWYVPHPKESKHVLRSKVEAETLWKEQGGEDGEMPAVDFDHSMVVAVFEGEGEYTTSHTIRRVIHHEGKVWVLVGQHAGLFPMTNPASVIVVPRVEDEVIFLDESDEQARSLIRVTEP